jgi:hypothetical protein
MLKSSLLIAGIGLSMAGRASATTTDNTVTAGPISAAGVYTVNSGHSSYSSFWLGSGSCGTSYSANGIRVATAHPRYQEMLRTLLAAELSGGWISYSYENISGQCWLKQIAVFMPGT